jgi:hypothetical protein
VRRRVESREAVRVDRALALPLGCGVLVFHIISPLAIIDQGGKVIHEQKKPEPIDLWHDYRAVSADSPTLPVQ